MPRTSKYPEEFRRQAAALVLDSGRSTRDVGRELGINHETLRDWGGCPEFRGTSVAARW